MGDALNPLISDILQDAVDRMLLQNRLRAVLAAYERAQKDPNVKIPTYMVAALEAAKQ